MSNITLVTGIWDIGRGTLSEGWSRPFQHYLDKFEQLLEVDANMIIFGEAALKEVVFRKRNASNTQFIERPLSWFKDTELFPKIQEIRSKEEWISQADWLKDSTQARLEYYNPLVMSKVFLLNDAKIMDSFNSEYLFWIDGGLTSTVHPGYFTHDKVLEKLSKYITKFSFICFPYEAEREIHGFEYTHLNALAGEKVTKVARGGFFGGPKHIISEINGIYYNLIKTTLFDGYMGTEESIFSIMCHSNAEHINYFEIESNGLIGKFFEDLKNDSLRVKTEAVKGILPANSSVALYALTYNSPNQFEKLCLSFEQYDKNFLEKPRKYLLNNSVDRSTDAAYATLCERYGFEEIKKDNIGICGGRQFIAEHAEENEFDYYFFFEDDMFFYLGPDEFCRNGFRRKIKDFYSTVMNIAKKEAFDFLKWNFSEFFGDNSKQWAWYNVPQDVREAFFPERPRKTENDLGKEPFLKYEYIKSHQGLPYATGEIYYCNWPQVVSREGSKKMFLDTKWAYPYEQTWMSFIYQETKKGNIKPGILLATPTEHNRFEFYPGEQRREN